MRDSAACCSWTSCASAATSIASTSPQTAPHVLQYAAELIIDGRKLDEPVNYALVRIIPPKGVEIDLERRPFVVVDPRAGHGPGIGGFKADSEIGVAMKAGPSLLFHRLPAGADAGPDHRALSRAPRPCSSRRSSACIPRPTASPA